MKKGREKNDWSYRSFLGSTSHFGEYPKKKEDFLKEWEKEFKKKVKHAMSVGDFSILMELRESDIAKKSEYEAAHADFIKKVKQHGYKIKPLGAWDNCQIRWDQNGN